MLLAVLKNLPIDHKKYEKATGIELRIDCFAQINLREIETFIRSSSLPVICTVRKVSHGGSFKGSEKERLALLRALLKFHPAFVDLEYDTERVFFQEVEEHFSQTKIISSYHNFTETPENLEAIVEKMQKTPAFIYKLSTMALSTNDALRMLIFVKQKIAAGLPVAGMCMGEKGAITRILAPLVGNFCTYASLGAGEESAPGQLSIDELIDIYRYADLNRDTSIYGLIGSPIEASIGHYAHNHWMRFLDINAVYVKMSVEADELAQFFTLAPQLGIKGLSVTMPLKELLLPYVKEIDPLAQKIGAINTLIYEKEKWHGFNTDAEGALQALEEKTSIKGKKVVLIGAGGAAKALAYAAVQKGAEVLILNRTPEKAKEIAASIGCRGADLEEIAQAWKLGYDILINTSAALLPIDPQWLLPKAIIMDIHTIPKNTDLLIEAKKRGCTVVYGYEMFRNQALGQVKIWFAKKVDQEKVKELLTSEILLRVV